MKLIAGAVTPVEVTGAAESTLDVTEIYQIHGKTVARWATRLGGPNFDAEEAVQEVFAVVQERLKDFRGEAKLTTWLYRITENVVRNQRRRERFGRWLSWRGEELAPRLISPRIEPVEALERLQASAEVYQVLNKMREPYRAALILYEMEDLSGAQIAELKGVKLATVWVWLHRARAQFLDRMTKLRRAQ